MVPTERQTTSHPQGIEPAQIINVRPDTFEDSTLHHVVKRQAHQVRVIRLHLPVFREVADHGVLGGPALNTICNLLVMPGIKMCVH